MTSPFGLLARALARIDELAALGPGWNGDGSLPPSTESLSKARELAELFARLGGFVPRIYPTLDGGVQFEWLHNRRDLTVTIHPDATFALFDVDLDTDDEFTLSCATVSDLTHYATTSSPQSR